VSPAEFARVAKIGKKPAAAGVAKKPAGADVAKKPAAAAASEDDELEAAGEADEGEPLPVKRRKGGEIDEDRRLVGRSHLYINEWANAEAQSG
jgi:hypothetical protein